MDLIIQNGQVVTGQGIRQLDVAVANGRICAIGTGLDGRGARQIDAKGKYVLPGIIDAHVHRQGDDTYESISRAAIYGGVTTTIYHYMPNTADVVEGVESGISHVEKQSLVDFKFHVRLVRVAEVLPHMRRLFELGISSFKLFMTYRKLGIMVDDYELISAADIIAEHGGLILTHAENGLAIDYLEDKFARLGEIGFEAYLRSHPTVLEGEAVFRAIAIAKLTRCPLYIVHVTSQDALQPIIWAKDRGDQVLFAETCPQYLSLTVDTFLKRGVEAKIGPPLRTQPDVDSLWQAVRTRDIDCVGSDHVAASRLQKQPDQPNTFHSWTGAPGIETMLPVMYTAGVRQGRTSLPRLVELMAERPAEIFGLAGRKGSIQPGADADLVLFDPRLERTLSRKYEHSNAYYSLFEGYQICGLPVMVFQRGVCLLKDGDIQVAAGQGRYLGAH
jgi:dihydropyrimidinase